MIKHYNPADVAPPFSNYSHGAEAPGDARWLHLSGQIGITADGTLLEGFEAQATQAWKNIRAILADAGMGPADIVKVNVFITDQSQVGEARTTRDAVLDGAQPASTLFVVAALAHPDWLVEIEVIAAAAA